MSTNIISLAKSSAFYTKVCGIDTCAFPALSNVSKTTATGNLYDPG
jgi:hypothetical protein